MASRSRTTLGRRLGVLVAAAAALTALTLGIDGAAAAPAQPAGDTGRPPPGYVLERGRFTPVTLPPGVDDPSALGIGPTDLNDRRQIVGIYDDVAADAGRGFLLSRGRFTTIHVPGAMSTQVWGINNRGQIVGVYSPDSNDIQAPRRHPPPDGLTTGDETIRVTSGRQFEIARLQLGKAVADANYCRSIDRLSRKIAVDQNTLSGLVEGSSQSIVEIENEIAVFAEAPERRVLSTSEATISPTDSSVQSSEAIPVVVYLDARQATRNLTDKIKEVLLAHHGDSPVQLHLRGEHATMVVRLGDEFRVGPRKGLYAELKATVGDIVMY